MSDADWDAEDFEPAEPEAEKAAKAVTDKWEGEDEEEDVKDNWDDDESKKEESTEGKAVQVKKKKPLKERLAEKEAKRLEEAKRRLEGGDSDEEDAEEQAANTPEGIAAAKERARRAQEESDLQLAKEAFGIEGVKGDSIDAANPVTKDDFDKFSECLKEKLQQYEKSIHYVGFLDTLFRDLSLSLEADDVKKIGATLTALSNEKIKQQKAKSKKKKKGVSLQHTRGDGLDDYEAAAYDGFDDFI